MKHSRQKYRGFTLIELMVVIGIIILASGIALPTISTLFNAGADAQAYNVLASTLTVARSQALINNTFVAVHVQLSNREDTPDTTYAAILIWDDEAATPGFKMLEGFTPQPIPGKYAFGGLTGDYVSSSESAPFQSIIDDDLDDFTTMTFVFNPSGQLTTTINGELPVFINSGLFTSETDIDADETTLWHNPAEAVAAGDAPPASAKPGVTAVTLFRYVDLVARNAADRASYLNENGQFLAINFYTGQMMPRE